MLIVPSPSFSFLRVGAETLSLSLSENMVHTRTRPRKPAALTCLTSHPTLFLSNDEEHVAGPSWQKRTQEDAELDQEHTHCFGAPGAPEAGQMGNIVEYEVWFSVADVLYS